MKVNNVVKFVNTGDKSLDNKIGVIKGWSYLGPRSTDTKPESGSIAIVLFNDIPEGYDPAIACTISCLEVVDQAQNPGVWSPRPQGNTYPD